MLHAIPALGEMATDKLSNEHLQVLQTVTRNLREERSRVDVGEEVLGKLCAVLSRLSTKCQRLSVETEPAEVTSLSFRLTADCFRALRNACVQCSVNQRCLRDLGSIELCFEILRNLLQLSSRRSEDGTEALRCGIQFLGNIAVGNQLCKEDIWKLGFPHIFWDLLQESDKKIIAYTCMVLHTCLDAHKTEHLARDTKQFQLSLKIIDLCRMLPDVEWTVLIATQHVLKSAILVKRLYTEMTDDGRLTLLELLLERFSDVEEEKDTVVPPDVAHFLACCFSDHCRDVLALTSESSGEAQAPGVVFRLLDVLCEMTSDCKAFMVLQDHPDLLSTTVGLLKEVHLLGKASRNVFTAAHDFSSTGPGGSDTHPALSFKAHLIRLIGNLCYEHIANQDKVRELDGIALILDNCSIDSNNPFISQWAVFAIRNLLEHNLENQKLIQGLQRRGVTDDSLLRDMGFRVEERDGSLLLRPVKKDP